MNATTYTSEEGAPQGPKDYSRRDALASISALSLAAIATASDALRSTLSNPLESNIDSEPELRALGAALEQAWDAEKAHEIATQGDGSEEAWERHEAITAVTSTIVDRICSLPAQTSHGLFVKARAFSWCFNSDDSLIAENFVAYSGDTMDVQLMASIVRDVLRMREARNA